MNLRFYRTTSKRFYYVSCLLLALTIGVAAIAEDELSAARKANLERVTEALRERRAAAEGAEHLFARRGLLADRRERKVIIDAEATGLEAGGVVEFPIIAEHSAHDYEALFISFAKPSDIRAALEFIGIPAGRGVSFKNHVFWPRGERVMVSVELPDGKALPIENMILDERKEGTPPMPAVGFIHAGSQLAREGDKVVLAADQEGPGSIASSYNEPTTLLDMPHQAMQGDVYERFIANPRTLVEKEAFVRITLTPEKRPDKYPERVVELALQASLPPGAAGLSGAVFKLYPRGADSAKVEEIALADALKQCRAMLPERDPYVMPDLDESLDVRTAKDLAALLLTLDNPGGIRVDSPKDGQVYYKAFLPDEAWRPRENRPTQPSELRFEEAGDGEVRATLVRIEEIWNEEPDNWRPTLKTYEKILDSPRELPELLEGTGAALPVLFVFATGDTRLGHIMPYLRGVLSTHPNIHIFIEK